MTNSDLKIAIPLLALNLFLTIGIYFVLHSTSKELYRLHAETDKRLKNIESAVKSR